MKKWILKLLHHLAARRPSFMIKAPDRSDYLLRVKLRGGLPRDKEPYRWSAFLHRIIRHDLDRHLHNHPWTWAVSLVLVGGYKEERLLKDGRVVTRLVKPWRLNFLGPGQYHRIVELQGDEVWTLFFGGRKINDWGFLVEDDEFVSHREYFQHRQAHGRAA